MHVRSTDRAVRQQRDFSRALASAGANLAPARAPCDAWARQLVGCLARAMNENLPMKRILVALDHSPRAPQVLARAASIAASQGAELFLLRAIGLPIELPADAYRSSPAEVVEMLHAASVRELEALAATLDPTLVVHVLVRSGVPWVAICEGAKAHEVDLIVVGSHGFSGLDHVLGTTAAKVVNHADRSVLVVRTAKPA